MSDPHDEYLWDKSGTPDPTIQRLEAVLAPFAHAPRPLRQPRRWLRAAAAGVAAVLLAAVAWGVMRGPEALAFVVLDGAGEVAARLRVGDTLRTSEAEPDGETMVLDSRVEVIAGPGSSVRIDRLDDERTRLFLLRGELDVFVSGDVRPRFFQVQTPATRCIDLGCRYTIQVDAAGVTTVEVMLGQVALADRAADEGAGREVYLPTGTRCTARPGRGAGVPVFVGQTPPWVEGELARLDAATAAPDRERIAAGVLAAIANSKGVDLSFVPWQLLNDRSPAIRRVAEDWLRRRTGRRRGSRQKRRRGSGGGSGAPGSNRGGDGRRLKRPWRREH